MRSTRMQREPLLLSSAKIGVPRGGVALSVRDVLLALFALIFIGIGAADLLSRAFTTGAPRTEALIQEYSQSASTSPVIEAAPFVPERLRIPTLGIDAAVESVGRKPDGAMKAPSRFDTTAWYSEGPRPGQAGNTVIAGHLNNALDTSGVFEYLRNVKLGDTVTLEGNGREATYVVRQMIVYDADSAPAEEVFSSSGPSRVALITCDGAWDRGKRSYDKRLVVYADLVSAR
jgi:LPXTG-site transpeptidase (sortase) family protein